jgi:hypothetical protein
MTEQAACPTYPYKIVPDILRTIIIIFVVFAAEIASSIVMWSGTPTDWPGEPLKFWKYEFLRMEIWAILGFLFLVIWILGWMLLRRLPQKMIGVIWVIIYMAALEIGTSFCFWNSVSEDALYLGWDSRFYYLRDHLRAWILIAAISEYHRGRPRRVLGLLLAPSV